MQWFLFHKLALAIFDNGIIDIKMHRILITLKIDIDLNQGHRSKAQIFKVKFVTKGK